MGNEKGHQEKSGQETDNLSEIDALQMRVAHQERQLDDLSDIVAAQSKQIDQLTRDLRILAERQRDLADTAFSQTQTDKPPPHY